MKSLKMHGRGKVSVVEAADPQPDDESVILRVAASALCGSELYTLRGETEPEDILNTGHELVGTIEYAPAGSGFSVGQRAGACVVQGCGHCVFCKAGDETGCENKRYDSGNGHSQKMKLGLGGVRVLPDDVDWPAGAILTGDGLGVPVRCANRLGETRGLRVVVLGLGPVGMSCLLVQKFLGAHVAGVDLSDYRLGLAEKLGAAWAVNESGDALLQRVMDWTDGRGADVVILAAAVPALFEQSAAIVRRHGRVFVVAEIENLTFNPSAVLLRREATLMGSWYYTSADWRRMLELHEAGLDYASLITHQFPLDEAQQAFDLFSAGQTGKVILSYS